MITPPQSPAARVPIGSALVKMIGAEGVPCAWIVAPRSTISAPLVILSP